MGKRLSRRRMILLSGRTLAGGLLYPAISSAAVANAAGAVSGEPTGALAGQKVLDEGGNAIDAAVAAALVACIASPGKCGIGGYGGHMTLASARRRKIVSIDFNSAAPAAAREDMFPLAPDGTVIGKINERGWLAAGVPGTLAGLQLALDRFGTRSFRELVQHAIALAEEGVAGEDDIDTPETVDASLNDPSPNPLQSGSTSARKIRNLPLARMLRTLASRNSVDSFYRGDIAREIAEAFKQNGGIVTARDLAAYRAREVKPLELRWDDFTIHTAPLTAGGLTTLEMFSILRELKWQALDDPLSAHRRLEAMRVAWHDRLELLGDPEKARVPVRRLLSAEYARAVAEEVRRAVEERRPIPARQSAPPQDGTANISAADRWGNLVSMTLTHGHGFGARVSVESLGLVLGHGMSRFEPRRGHPNSVAPGKRPLHNMCPSVVSRGGMPVLAVGGAGGVRIPNSLFDFLAAFVIRRASMEEALAAPRLHCTGDMNVAIDGACSKATREYLAALGYKVQNARAGFISAACFDPLTRECRAVMR